MPCKACGFYGCCDVRCRAAVAHCEAQYELTGNGRRTTEGPYDVTVAECLTSISANAMGLVCLVTWTGATFEHEPGTTITRTWYDSVSHAMSHLDPFLYHPKLDTAEPLLQLLGF